MSVRNKLWTREEYDRLVAAGAFAPDARIQLIEGELIEMTPQGAAHATGVRRLQKALERALPQGYEVRAQLPLALGRDPRSEPEPDIAVVPGSVDDYRDHHPATAVLVVEVADTSLEFDRTRKMVMYARAGIPEYWVLNLADSQLEAFRDPGESGYGTRLVLGSEDSVSPVTVPKGRFKIATFFP